jgi:DNA-binding NarL/FixJ family response regulator
MPREPKTKPSLSTREKQVLRLIRKGYTYPRIAHRLNVGLETVKTYAARLRTKIGADTKVGLAVWATENSF